MKRQKSQSINTNGIDNTKCSRFYEARVQTSERTVHQSKSCEQSVLAEKKNESVEKMKGDQFWTRPPADLEVTIMKQTSEAKNNYQERKMENDSGKSFVTESMIFHSLNNYNNKGKLDPREEKRKFWENCRKNESVRRFKWGDSIKPIRISSPLTTVGSSESLYSRSEKIDTKHQTNAKIERSKSCEPNDWMGTNPFFADVFPLEGLKHEIMVKANNPFMANERLSSSEFRNEKSMSDQNIRDRYAFASNNDLQCKETSFQIDDKLTNTGKDSSGTKYYSKITTNDAKSQDIKENSSKEEFNVKCEFFEKATSVPISCVNENAKGLVEARLKEGSSSCPNSSFIWPTLHSTAETDSSNMAATSNKSPQFEMPTKERSFYASPTPKLPAHSSLKKPSHFIALQRNSPVEIRAEENLPSTVEKTDNQEMYGFQEHKKRTLTQSSYEKIIRDRSSPYENVESSSRREYKEEELIRPLNIKDRSSTPSGFYDNHFEEVYQEIRSASPAVCVLSDTFEEIRSKVGNLLGGTPLVWKARPVHYPPEQGIEEAFQELAAKEGLVGDISSYDLYYDQFTRQSSQIASGNGSNSQLGEPVVHHAAPPPPPPPPTQGAAPIRLASEIGPAKKSYEPPAAIQNAMMTKDKKPFTYTPGGLDLAEIRSPRMARRINRNAHMEDSCSGPQIKPPGMMQPHSMPPSAIAAMQPQLPVPVFPPGADISPGGSSVPPPPQAFGGSPPPPPPPLPTAGACPPPPPPPMPDSSSSPQMQSNQTTLNQQPYRPKNGNHSPPTYLQDIQNRPALKPVTQNNLPKSPPDFVSEIPCHSPLKPVNHPPRSSYEPSSTSPIQVQLKPVSPKPAPTPQNSSPPYIPQPPQISNQQKFQDSPQSLPHATRNIQDTNSSTAQQKQIQSPKPSVYIPPNQASPPNVTPVRQTPPSPAPLNKSPAPWMTNRQAQKESPPWTMRQGSFEERGTPPISGSTTPLSRVIPIQVEGREPLPNYQQQMAQQMQQMQIQMQQQIQQQQRQMQQQMNPNMSVTYSPPITKQNNIQPKQDSPQGRTRIIPIQIEGASGDANNQSKNYSTQQSYPNHNSSPVGYAAQNQNRFPNSPQADSIQRTSSVDATDHRSRQLQSQVSWTQGTNNPIQSRSFRVLQKITGSEDQPSAPINQAQLGETFLVNRVLPNSQADVLAGADNNTDWDINTSPTFPQGYPNPNYWYYPPPQTLEEQQQFWEHYNAMCAYMAHMNAAAYRYSPYPFYPMYPTAYPSETEEYSGYSSSDEMAYYGQMFMNQRAQQNSELNAITPNTESTSDESEVSNNSEVDLKNYEQINALKSIKSVPNINIYNEKDNPEMKDNIQFESEEEDDDDEDDDDDESEYGSEASNHLSVIIEESEQSSDAEGFKRSRESFLYESDAASSSSTLNNNDNSEEDEENSVTVRLPLQFKISRSANDEEVTTVIVGTSEVESNSQEQIEPDDTLIITDIVREDSDPEISATIRLKRRKSDSSQSPVATVKEGENTDGSVHNSESPIDFWKEMGNDKEPGSSSRTNNDTPGSHSLISEDDLKQEESDFHWEDDSSSTSLQTVKKGQSGSENYSGSEIEAAGTADEIEDLTIHSPTEKLSEISNTLMNCGQESSGSEDSSESEDDTSDSSSSSSDDEDSKDFNESRSKREVVEPSDFETDPRGKYGRAKSQEESEEDDSGVTSDISRHISETDTDAECGGSELQKMTRYQRAATHSRLFKLLQEECSQEDAAEESMSVKKERLMLPLNKHSSSEQDSLSSSSGINSPSSPTVTDRLVKELIQSLLSRKKGRHFRKLPMEKLYAAAMRILQEDMDPYDTGSTSDDSNLFLSPVSGGNPYSQQQAEAKKFKNTEIVNPENYGANYYDYCNYYSTWGNVNNYSQEEIDFDILPSKTFRILQENSQTESGYKTPVKGLGLVRCPRVASSQNLEKQNNENSKSPCESEPISSNPQET
ncbi:uncharacterized protein isoform X3 [Rhodnius prolixus]